MIVTMKEEKIEFLHSWYVLVITFFSLLFLLINNHFFLDLLLASFVFFIYFMNGLTAAAFRKYVFYATLFGFSLFVINILYPADALKSGHVFHLMKINIYEKSLDKALHTMLKLFFVTVVSMSSSAVIDYTKVILHLIVHKGLKLFWGYPVLLALNSIALFKTEFERIKINAHLRDLPLKDKIFIFFPLLVFAIRHSQRGALSLVTRGLNHQKSFYFSYGLSSQDRTKLFLFWMLYFGLVIMALLPLR